MNDHHRTAQSSLPLPPSLATIQVTAVRVLPCKATLESRANAGKGQLPREENGELSFQGHRGLCIETRKSGFHHSGDVQLTVALPLRGLGSSTPFQRRFYLVFGLKRSRNGPFSCRIIVECLVTYAIYELNNRSLTLEFGRIWKYRKDKVLRKLLGMVCFLAAVLGLSPERKS